MAGSLGGSERHREAAKVGFTFTVVLAETELVVTCGGTTACGKVFNEEFVGITNNI